MKFKDDPWLTDYINSIHFAIRLIERQTGDRRALRRLMAETDALVQEAILGNIPLELMTIRRLAGRIRQAELHLAKRTALPAETQSPNIRQVVLKSYTGRDAGQLVTDYHFLRDGYEEFTLRGMIEECRLYLEKIYPDIGDMAATVSELFSRDIASRSIEEHWPGVWRHVVPAASVRL
ncbi:hypothetical protein DENIS_3826 [Desulfonema ishimotonii]|uniref:Uncharacterized protein n=1 Tax=Desulfonema ishimotonii TaxID=45657 RepID=A0A401G0U3_9BACT|nr:hypothetical protein [Desulfonema ishimotonii]GBC62842.1 hypothetical protein DENIS_3826 [Desulfonema ishimotonii]